MTESKKVLKVLKKVLKKFTLIRPATGINMPITAMVEVGGHSF
jgi:hypothetical protein